MADYDLQAEMIVLGSMMTAGGAVIDEVRPMLRPVDFLRSAHGRIFSAICAEWDSHGPVGPVAIAAALDSAGELGMAGGTEALHKLVSLAAEPGRAGGYAEIVAKHAARRRMRVTGQRILQATSTAAMPLEAIAAHVQADLDSVPVIGDGYRAPEALDLDAFADAESETGEEVIPDLLDRQERLILVAPEGSGKTTLAMQVAIMGAAGLSPLSCKPMDPIRTLLIDLENPPALLQKRARFMRSTARERDEWDPKRCQFWCEPGGVDVRDPAGRRLLMSLIARAQPDLVLAGPLYKMTIDRGERAEQQAGSTAAFWDEVRSKFGCALWLEGHAPMEQANGRFMRPINSSLWSRWPEYGIALTKSSDPRDKPGSLKVGTFRGHRQHRVWPVRLEWSRPWPWRGVWALPSQCSPGDRSGTRNAPHPCQ